MLTEFGEFLPGLENLCLDIEFMLGRGRSSLYWRLCWGIITPAMMLVVFFYALVSFEAVTFGDDYEYPTLGIGKALFNSPLYYQFVL